MLPRHIICTLTNSILLDAPILVTSARRICTNRIRSPNTLALTLPGTRCGSSSGRWQTRQSKDKFTKEAKVQGLKSRAAFKLLEVDIPFHRRVSTETIADSRGQMNEKYRIFKKGQTVVDLGYAPGSWSQVAIDRTSPGGRVIGIDIIPAQPPRGMSTIQGNFLSPAVQECVKSFLRDPERGRARPQIAFSDEVTEDELEQMDRGYIDLERRAVVEGEESSTHRRPDTTDRTVDVVLSDMSEPWPQTTGYGKRSLSNPYRRMMNTSGMKFRDHAGSMDLCNAALHFAQDTLHPGGHFICKFYQGSEDSLLESTLKKLFSAVHREKPESSRSESKEAYFVALRRKAGP